MMEEHNSTNECTVVLGERSHSCPTLNEEDDSASRVHYISHLQRRRNLKPGDHIYTCTESSIYTSTTVSTRGRREKERSFTSVDTSSARLRLLSPPAVYQSSLVVDCYIWSPTTILTQISRYEELVTRVAADQLKMW